MDFGGLILFCAGFILFLMGLSWGGEVCCTIRFALRDAHPQTEGLLNSRRLIYAQLYPWNSAHVIATLIIGFFTIVAFVIYGKPLVVHPHDVARLTSIEIYMPLNRPLVPMYLFKNRDYVVLTIVSAVGGMLYYSLNGKRSFAGSAHVKDV